MEALKLMSEEMAANNKVPTCQKKELEQKEQNVKITKKKWPS